MNRLRHLLSGGDVPLLASARRFLRGTLVIVRERGEGRVMRVECDKYTIQLASGVRCFVDRTQLTEIAATKSHLTGEAQL